MNTYARNDEWSGFSIHKARTGFVVDCWCRIQGSPTEDKYLLPYESSAAGGYEKNVDFESPHNEYMTVGEFLGNYALRWNPGVRVLRKGHIVT